MLAAFVAVAVAAAAAAAAAAATAAAASAAAAATAVLALRPEECPAAAVPVTDTLFTHLVANSFMKA